MRIAAYCPPNLPHSSRIYAESVIAGMERTGQRVDVFAEAPLPEADVYWQPSAGRNGPDTMFKGARAPVAVTFHGAANLSMPLRLCFGPGAKNTWRGLKSRMQTLHEWRWRRAACDTVITVSAYAKREAHTRLHIPLDVIEPIHHGVDHDMFTPSNGAPAPAEPYLLHVSSYQPKKNLDRILAAYARMTCTQKPRLTVVAPGYPRAVSDAGVEFISRPLDHQHLAALYRDALGFVFPSLHETFGMPIVEAMACGCPVITSDHPACVEIAGEAAVIVDPYSVEAIAAAMDRLTADPAARASLRDRGIRRAAEFSWAKSAREHLRVFRKMATHRVSNGA